MDVLRGGGGGTAIRVLDVDGGGEGVVGANVEEEAEVGEEACFVVAE